MYMSHRRETRRKAEKVDGHTESDAGGLRREGGAGGKCGVQEGGLGSSNYAIMATSVDRCTKGKVQSDGVSGHQPATREGQGPVRNEWRTKFGKYRKQWRREDCKYNGWRARARRRRAGEGECPGRRWSERSVQRAERNGWMLAQRVDDTTRGGGRRSTTTLHFVLG